VQLDQLAYVATEIFVGYLLKWLEIDGHLAQVRIYAFLILIDEVGYLQPEQ
jgi:hypothetical protein